MQIMSNKELVHRIYFKTLKIHKTNHSILRMENIFTKIFHQRRDTDVNEPNETHSVSSIKERMAS